MKSGAVLDSRYQLVTLLGKGAMGAVWRGNDLKIHRPVAVKIVLDHSNPKLIDRMIREAAAAGRLSHPHIVTVHDYGQTEHDGLPVTYLVMELVSGQPLTGVLAKGRPDLSVALNWARQIALALAAAHAPGVGVVHRDLKPDNVLITGDDLVKLVDFGIARFISDQHVGDAKLTSPGALIGTPAYMAPEQCMSKPVDGRTDLYALGCLLYEMVTGSPPFTGSAPLAVALAQVHDTPAAPRSRNRAVPAELDTLIRELLAKDPDLRPTDATVVHQWLATIAATHHDELQAALERRLLAPTPRALMADLGYGKLRHHCDGSGGAMELEHVAMENNIPKAVRLWRESAEKLTETLGPRHDRTLTVRRAFAWYTGASGDHEQAARLWQELVLDLQYVFGHFHEVTFSAQRYLAWNAGIADGSEEAVRLLKGAIPDASRFLGHRHVDVLEARRLLAWHVGEMGRRSRAVRLLRKLVADLTEVLGPRHENTLEARLLLAWNAEKSGDRAKAVRWLWEFLPDAGRALGPDHAHCVEARRLLDRCTQ